MPGRPMTEEQKRKKRERERERQHDTPVIYTCQLFLGYRREIFILGVLGFLKTARSFPKISEVFRSLSETYKRV